MEAVIIEHEGKWWKFEIPVSASGEMGFFEAGYTGQFYAVQEVMEGATSRGFVEGKGMGPDHYTAVGGVLKDAYLWFLNGTLIKGKQVKLG